MKKILISLLLTISLSSSASQEELNDSSLNNIINRNRIDLDTKSTKGWIRLFNSKAKIKDYNFVLNEEERLIMLKFLKNNFKKDTKKYERGLK